MLGAVPPPFPPGPPRLSQRAAPGALGSGRADGAVAAAPGWGSPLLAIWLERLETFPLLPCHLCVCVCVCMGVCVCARGCAAPSPAAGGSGRGGRSCRLPAGGARQPRSCLFPIPTRALQVSRNFCVFIYLFLTPPKGRNGASGCRGGGGWGGVFVLGIWPYCGGEGREGAPGTRIASFPLPCPSAGLQGDGARPASPSQTPCPCPTGHPLAPQAPR